MSSLDCLSLLRTGGNDDSLLGCPPGLDGHEHAVCIADSKLLLQLMDERCYMSGPGGCGRNFPPEEEDDLLSRDFRYGRRPMSTLSQEKPLSFLESIKKFKVEMDDIAIALGVDPVYITPTASKQPARDFGSQRRELYNKVKQGLQYNGLNETGEDISRRMPSSPYPPGTLLYRGDYQSEWRWYHTAEIGSHTSGRTFPTISPACAIKHGGTGLDEREGLVQGKGLLSGWFEMVAETFRDPKQKPFLSEIRFHCDTIQIQTGQTLSRAISKRVGSVLSSCAALLAAGALPTTMAAPDNPSPQQSVRDRVLQRLGHLVESLVPLIGPSFILTSASGLCMLLYHFRYEGGLAWGTCITGAIYILLHGDDSAEKPLIIAVVTPPLVFHDSYCRLTTQRLGDEFGLLVAGTAVGLWGVAALIPPLGETWEESSGLNYTTALAPTHLFTFYACAVLLKIHRAYVRGRRSEMGGGVAGEV
ncbi:hypothetical protein BCR34DRAFT_637418 [Clohesyomyces aquaticus]|uniref:Uncharacterized protein n=1 Tax=Clohesyomyces aquaticus TaxID=1231657 RepID=A0A1Y1YTG4_9PLEO|nr:hypothetical protein BCR34DRAFT_637418 [Clohesyomyces aquaticus]